jgi:hypothetical protein
MRRALAVVLVLLLGGLVGVRIHNSLRRNSDDLRQNSDTFDMVILGGSAAVGEPYHPYGVRRLAGSKFIADIINGISFKDGIKQDAAA